MSASGAYRFKPNDLATTPTGRMVKILEVLPYGERRVMFMDTEEGDQAHFRVCHLTLVATAAVVPWTDRSPQ